MNPSRTIRTPDQRLRVFVSSTLKELAPERKAARTAIERLHLAPVMFELGARPHPPRDLYRSYLEQSDVFVGLYGDRYGWVAPGEEVSGLADEYLLSPRTMPKLIYIRESESREPRLTELLDRIRSDDSASFKYFSEPRELRGFLEADLATLLAERFDQSRPTPPDVPRETQPAVVDSDDAVILPAPLTELIGRERELESLERMLRGGSTRMLTLTGPGGIGKSRLAIAAADRVRDAFGGGVRFVDFSAVRDPALVPSTLAQALGVQDIGDTPVIEKLVMALRARRLLLILDNFEQIVEAAPTLTHLLTAAPDLTLLVTSRTLLRVSVEHSFPVGPLALPGTGAGIDEVSQVPAVTLFVERAHAVKPDFELTAANVAAVVGICTALDGVPLALELAAAKVRVLSPAAMLERLDRLLAFLGGGPRDLPARQQTLRQTIEWSTQMLGDDEKNLLATIGVFEGGFSLEAVEKVWDPDMRADTLGVLGTLVDNSLVRQQDRGDRSYFSVLATVRAYALEQLESAGTLAEMKERHARFFLGVGVDAEAQLEGPMQREWMVRLTDDRDNLLAVERYLLEREDWDRAAEFVWTLYIFWWVGGHHGEVRRWMESVLASGAPLADLTRAVALYYTRAITFWQDPDGQVVPGLLESAELFRRAGDPPGEALTRISLALALLAAREPDPAGAAAHLESSLAIFRDTGDNWGEAMALVALGRVALLQHDVQDALERFQNSLTLARKQREQLGEAIALHHLGWAQLLLGSLPDAQTSFDESLSLSLAASHDEGIAYGLEGMVATSASRGELERAGRLLGAAERLREQSGLYNAPSFSFHQQWVGQILASDGASLFEQARAAGRTLSARAAAEEALRLPAHVTSGGAGHG
ncbi:ATP-binding protein [Mycetocola sp.]|uniref:ATP-binding protein n=1 Tax=Mycetocola sp. TaxID=1871042 RepID=UPI003988F2AD